MIASPFWSYSLSTTTKRLKQPIVFPLAIANAMCERFGFYALSFLLVLYVKSAFGLSDHEAFLLFSVFTALVFLTPAIGGWLADNVFGIRRAIVAGLSLEAFGLTLLVFPEKMLLYPALALIITGVGLFKTAPTDLMARSYDDNDPRIDGGFTLYYMAMNLGSIFAPILAGFLQRYFGWHYAFLTGAIALYIGIATFFLLHHRAAKVDAKPGYEKLPFKTWALVFVSIIGSVIACTLLVRMPTVAQIFFVITTVLVGVYFVFEIGRSPKREKLEIIACLSLIIMGMLFFTMYFQYYMSVTLFIQRSVRHEFLGVNIPTAAFLSLNSIWIVILSPILIWAYSYFGKRGKDLAITTKFPLGLLIISLCFLSFKWATLYHDIHGQISPLWMVWTIFLYSLGELLISALGVAMVTRIAPQRMYGVMMGAWYLIAAALASSLSSLVASLASIPKNIHDPLMILNIYGNTFLYIGLAGLAATAVAFAVSPYIRRIANID